MIRRCVARWRAYRKERAALLKMVDLLREDERQMRRNLVRLMCGSIDPDTIWEQGRRYRCHKCGRMYKQGRQNIWGYCRRCS